jgi:hypothetical protein
VENYAIPRERCGKVADHQTAKPPVSPHPDGFALSPHDVGFVEPAQHALFPVRPVKIIAAVVTANAAFCQSIK